MTGFEYHAPLDCKIFISLVPINTRNWWALPQALHAKHYLALKNTAVFYIRKTKYSPGPGRLLSLLKCVYSSQASCLNVLLPFCTFLDIHQIGSKYWQGRLRIFQKMLLEPSAFCHALPPSFIQAHYISKLDACLLPIQIHDPFKYQQSIISVDGGLQELFSMWEYSLLESILKLIAPSSSSCPVKVTAIELYSGYVLDLQMHD